MTRSSTGSISECRRRGRIDQLSADTMPKLADGSINAVLSLGDGGAGRKLGSTCPVSAKSPIRRRFRSRASTRRPMTVWSRTREPRSMPPAVKPRSELWLALSTRLEENYQRMRQNGVAIRSKSRSARSLQRCERERRRRSAPGAGGQGLSAPRYPDAFSRQTIARQNWRQNVTIDSHAGAGCPNTTGVNFL